MADQPGTGSVLNDLVLDTDGDRRVMSPSREYEIGRDPLGDVVLTDPRVSWHHAVLHVCDGHWAVDDVGSTNGTFDAVGHRVRHLEIGPGCRLRFGNPTDGPLAALSVRESPAPKRAARPSALTSSASSIPWSADSPLMASTLASVRLTPFGTRAMRSARALAYSA